MSVQATVDPGTFWPGARLAAGFCLEAARLLTDMLDENLTPTVIVLGVLSANVAAHDRAVSGPTGAATPFDAINRDPVSVYRLARNLDLPYETARRHVGRLVKKGVCTRVGQGLVLSAPVVLGPPSVLCVQEVWRLATQLQIDLGALGLDVPAPDPSADANEQRRVGRMANEFFLAGMRLVVEATHSDLVTALTFLAVYCANRPLPEDDPYRLRADHELTAVSVYALSRQMRLPYETVRRHVGILLGENLCRKAEGGGLIVSDDLLMSPALVAASLQAKALTIEFLTTAFGPVAIRSVA